MKKLIIAFILVLNAGTCFGAVSEDMSVYLRKDVFDAKMEAFMKEMRGELREIRGEFQVMNAKIDALSRRVDDNYHALEKRIDDNYRSLDARISDVRNGMYLLLVMLGIVISLPTVQKMLQSREDRKEAKQNFITLEDFKRLIAENNAELMKSVFTKVV